MLKLSAYLRLDHLCIDIEDDMYRTVTVAVLLPAIDHDCFWEGLEDKSNHPILLSNVVHNNPASGNIL